MKTALFFCFYFFCCHVIDSYYTGSPISGPPTLPERAMKTNAIQAFHINTDSNTECPLSPAKYFVMKHFRINRFREDEFVFYAADYSAVIETRFSIPDFPTKGAAKIGQITCRQGMIDVVHINNHARRCGVAKVLSALCMLDPQIHSVEEGNNAFRVLDRYMNNVQVDYLRKCLRLVALVNDAKPYVGAFAYLKAAHLSGLQYLVVRRNTRELRRLPKRAKDCYGEFLEPYEVNHILTKNLFDGNTGLIENIAGSGTASTWYFCRR